MGKREKWMALGCILKLLPGTSWWSRCRRWEKGGSTMTRVLIWTFWGIIPFMEMGETNTFQIMKIKNSVLPCWIGDAYLDTHVEMPRWKLYASGGGTLGLGK